MKKGQKIELRIEQSFINCTTPFICLYVDGKLLKFIALDDYGKVRGTKKWIKDTLRTQKIQSKIK